MEGFCRRPQRIDWLAVMALLNRPLTAEEVQLLAGDLYLHVPALWAELCAPRYQAVRYRAVLDRTEYELANTFYDLGPTSPSDCVWMVPVSS